MIFSAETTRAIISNTFALFCLVSASLTLFASIHVCVIANQPGIARVAHAIRNCNTRSTVMATEWRACSTRIIICSVLVESIVACNTCLGTCGTPWLVAQSTQTLCYYRSACYSCFSFCGTRKCVASLIITWRLTLRTCEVSNVAVNGSRCACTIACLQQAIIASAVMQCSGRGHRHRVCRACIKISVTWTIFCTTSTILTREIVQWIVVFRLHRGQALQCCECSQCSQCTQRNR